MDGVQHAESGALTGVQSWGDPGQSRESGGSGSEHAIYATQQPAPSRK